MNARARNTPAARIRTVLLLSCCLLAPALSALSALAQQPQAVQSTPKRIPLPISVTWYFKALPTAWPKPLPKPVQVSKVTHKGAAAYAVTWTGVQLWDALPPGQKKRTTKTVEMERYWLRILSPALQ